MLTSGITEWRTHCRVARTWTWLTSPASTGRTPKAYGGPCKVHQRSCAEAACRPLAPAAGQPGDAGASPGPDTPPGSLQLEHRCLPVSTARPRVPGRRLDLPAGVRPCPSGCRIAENERLYAPLLLPGRCPLYVREPATSPAHSPRPPGPADSQRRIQTLAITSVSAGQMISEALSAEARRWPDPAHA